MNKDQVKGGAKEMAGKVQQETGKMTDDKSQQAKGIGKRVAGKIQEGYGDAKEAVTKDSKKTH